ncbi:hypothetical protein F4779DRAFT_603969 [Xylariaceae sp. FL0662B]|nr:hypothetical protein F4779DRAFT_603969 [Xylariaceae sp. FL0662B]
MASRGYVDQMRLFQRALHLLNQPTFSESSPFVDKNLTEESSHQSQGRLSESIMPAEVDTMDFGLTWATDQSVDEFDMSAHVENHPDDGWVINESINPPSKPAQNESHGYGSWGTNQPTMPTEPEGGPGEIWHIDESINQPNMPVQAERYPDVSWGTDQLTMPGQVDVYPNMIQPDGELNVPVKVAFEKAFSAQNAKIKKLEAENMVLRGDRKIRSSFALVSEDDIARNRQQRGAQQQVIEKMKEDKAAMEEKLFGAVNEVLRLRRLEENYSMDGWTMTTKWSNVRFGIKYFSREHLNNTMDLTMQPENCADFFAPWSLIYEEFLTTADRPNYIFQAVIWKFLYDEILKTPCKIWGEPFSEAISVLSDSFSNHDTEEPMRDYQIWRARCGLNMMKYRGISKERLDGLVARLSLKLLPFVSKCSDDRLETFVRETITTVTELAVIFNRSKTYYTCTMFEDQMENLQFCDATMRDQGDDETNDSVRLVISPLITQSGGIQGGYLEKPVVVQEAYIHC